MKIHMIRFAVAASLAAAPLASHALGTNEKGCLVGGAAGGVAGHVAGDHTVLGAALGCGAGVLINKNRVKKKDEEAAANKREDVAARKAREKRQLAQQEHRVPESSRP